MKKEIFKTLSEKYKTEKTEKLVAQFNSMTELQKDKAKHALKQHAEKGSQDAASAWYAIHYEQSTELTDSTNRIKNFE